MADHDDYQTEEDDSEEGNDEIFDEESDFSDDELDPPKRSENTKRGTRGRTKLQRVFKNRSKGIREKIQYNEMGQEVEEASINFQSFLGIIAREYIPINISDWRKVDKQIKARLWDEVNKTFIVDSKAYAQTLRSISKKWRQFKWEMTDFIYENKEFPDMILQPPYDYSDVIKPEHWKEFLASRLRPEWAALREKQQKIRASYKLQHRTSRKPFARVKKELEKSNPGIEPGRVDVWIESRRDKKGQITNEHARHVVETIADLNKRVREGTLNIFGSNDVLTMALHKPEHPGQVRGVGGFVTPTSYFGTPAVCLREIQFQQQQWMLQQQKIWEQRNRQLEERLAATEKELKDLKDSKMTCPTQSVQNQQFVPKHQQFDTQTPQFVPQQQSLKITFQRRSLVQEQQVIHEQQTVPKEKPCKLALRSLDNVVAKGFVIEVSSEAHIHGIPLGELNYRVSVKEVDPDHVNEPLPIPVGDEMTTIAHAIGSHVAWPKVLVIIDDMPVRKRRKKTQANEKTPQALPQSITDENLHNPKSSKVPLTQSSMTDENVHHQKSPNLALTQPHQQENILGTSSPATNYISSFLMPSKLARLWTYVNNSWDKNDSRSLKLHSNILGVPVDLLLSKDDVREFCDLQEIRVSVITIYYIYLYRVLESRKITDIIKFVDPSTVILLAGNRKIRAQSLAERMSQVGQHQLLVIPWNIGQHWILVLIRVDIKEVHIFNPLDVQKIDLDVKTTITHAFKYLRRHQKRQPRENYIFRRHQAPICQPSNFECGYYVMRMMKELLKAGGSIECVINSKFNNKEMYDIHGINTVRENWASCVIDGLQLDL